MDNKEMKAPPITSLAMGSEPPNPHRPKPTPSWHAPFIELLGLLKVIDKSKRPPKVDDQRFCFQPSNDLSEISRVFLLVSTSGLKYHIDLKTIRAVNSDAVPSAVTKLQEYANNVLRRIQQFRDRLLQGDVINDSACFLHVDMFTCPVCSDPLISCIECDAKVACTNALCLASLVVDCEQCFAHSRMACIDCLKKNDTVPPLICCPMCQGWCCREDSDWCPGLVIQPTLGSKELRDLSRECDWDNEMIVRSHPPKPSPCRFCTDHDFPSDWASCRNSIDDMEPDRCPSQTPFMTDHSLHAAYCPDCLEQSPGRRCACDLNWLCDMCFAVGNKSLDYPHFITCPRCGVNYCTGHDLPCVNHIDLCRGCKGVILCNDCQEQEELPGNVHMEQDLPKEVVFTEQCNFCEAWTCGNCSSAEGTGRCTHCNEWFCRGCIDEIECDVLQPCLFCGGHVCRDCRTARIGCGGQQLWPMQPMSQPYPYHN